MKSNETPFFISPGSVPTLPNSTSWSSVMMRIMLGRMFLRSLWMRPLKPWALVVMKAQLPGTHSKDSRANQASHRISIVSEMNRGGMRRWEDKWRDEKRGRRGPDRPLTHSPATPAAVADWRERKKEKIKHTHITMRNMEKEIQGILKQQNTELHPVVRKKVSFLRNISPCFASAKVFIHVVKANTFKTFFH